MQHRPFNTYIATQTPYQMTHNMYLVLCKLVSFIVKVNMRSGFIVSNLPMTLVPEGVLWTCLFQNFWLLIMLWSLYWKSKMTAKYVRQKWKYLLLHCTSIYEHFYCVYNVYSLLFTYKRHHSNLAIWL